MRIRRLAFIGSALLTLLLAVLVFTGGRAGPRYVPGLRKATPLPEEAAARVTREEHRFTGAHGTSLFAEAWLPAATAPRGALVVMHGLKDHADRYAELALVLAQDGFAVHAFDLRGHGDSEGDRVWVERFDDYLDDLELFLQSVRARHPGAPLFLLGHSMGGAIATLTVLERRANLSGLILSAPALKPGADVNGALIAVTGVLGSATPRLPVLELPDEQFSRDPKTQAEMKSDPLISPGAGPARTAKELLSALRRIGGRMEEVSVPLLILHGTSDSVTNPDGSRELAQRARAQDKTLQLYDGLFHDLLHEPERAQVIEDVRQWLAARAPLPTPPASAAVAVDVP